MDFGPWNQFDSRRLRRSVRSGFWAKSISVDEGRGTVCLLEDPVELFEMFLRGLPPKSRRAREECLNSFDSGAGELFACLDNCAPQAVRSRALVSCFVDRLFGDSWGIQLYETPSRGYVVFHGDGTQDESGAGQLLGMWEPVSNSNARRECAVRCYASSWEGFCLPPALGEYATGWQPLWLECLLDLLRNELSSWALITSQMPRQKSVPARQWNFVKKHSGVGGERLVHLYRQAGVDVPASAAGKGGAARGAAPDTRTPGGKHPVNSCREPPEDDDDCEDEAPDYGLLAEEAASDDDVARFLVANYCYVLEHTDSEKRGLDSIY